MLNVACGSIRFSNCSANTLFNSRTPIDPGLSNTWANAFNGRRHFCTMSSVNGKRGYCAIHAGASSDRAWTILVRQYATAWSAVSVVVSQTNTGGLKDPNVFLRKDPSSVVM